MRTPESIKRRNKKHFKKQTDLVNSILKHLNAFVKYHLINTLKASLRSITVECKTTTEWSLDKSVDKR